MKKNTLTSGEWQNPFLIVDSNNNSDLALGQNACHAKMEMHPSLT